MHVPTADLLGKCTRSHPPRTTHAYTDARALHNMLTMRALCEQHSSVKSKVGSYIAVMRLSGRFDQP